MKTIAGMVCITAMGLVYLWKYGDGGILMSCVTAISALAGVQVGAKIAEKVQTTTPT